MANRTARIKVRLKGTNVVRLIKPEPELNVNLMQYARTIAKNTELDGFLIVGWTANGGTETGWQIGQIRGILAAAMINTIVTAHLLQNHELDLDND